MKLTAKLVVVFTLGNILLATVYGYLAVLRDKWMFRRTAIEEAQIIGNAMQNPIADVWRRDRRMELVELLLKASLKESGMSIHWVWFDAGSGDDFSPTAPVEQLTLIAIDGPLVVEAADRKGAPCLYVYEPVALEAGRKGGLEFSRHTDELEKNQREIVRWTASLIGGMVAISGLFAVVLGIRFVGDPLRQLIEKTRRIAAGDLTGPIHIQSHDEIAELAESLNQMCRKVAESQATIREETARRVAAMEQLRHADRLKTVGRLASGIAHELGTPLNVIAGRAGLIASGKLAAEEVAQSAVAIKSETEKITQIIRQLLDFARRGTSHRTTVDLGPVVRQIMELLATLAEKRQVGLRFEDPGAAMVVEADPGQIQQVLTNLIVNAIQAMPAGGNVEIAIRRRRAAPLEGERAGEKNFLCISVRDHGVGISEEHMQHLFEPFFTTKPVGEGTGLGLSIAYGIVQEHGGWIDVTSRPGEGSCFTVFLPAEPAP